MQKRKAKRIRLYLIGIEIIKGRQVCIYRSQDGKHTRRKYLSDVVKKHQRK